MRRPNIVLGKEENDGISYIRHLITRRSFKILVSFSIYYLFLIQYYHHANYRDPTSYFFDPTRAYERMYSTNRIKEVDAFIMSAELLTTSRNSSQPPTICVGIATVTRRGEQYVRRTIGSLLAGLSIEERDDIYLDILIGHTNRSTHPIFSEKWVRRLLNKMLAYKKADINRIKA
ncbi:hypothetical protein BDZ45DRAFT_751681 [Acephala macrosclerotiorum]|nr:hypothetical protein BDZ45DRAFT_751681 [Acephala macrosclerotiorum]